MKRDTRPAEFRVWDQFISSALSAPDYGCWRWSGQITKDGYGRISVQGKDRPAHCFVYEMLVGPIPAGMVLDHECRNRSCVNPAHLTPRTNKDNTLRGVSFAAHNARKTHCPKGHPYDDANTYRTTGNRRGCRACRIASQQERRHSLQEVTASARQH